MPIATLNSSTATAVVPLLQDRRWLYLENPSGIDIRWACNPAVTFAGANIGALLKAGERREFTAEQFGPISQAVYAIAESGTPSLTWLDICN
jgi:hypothetical protein